MQLPGAPSLFFLCYLLLFLPWAAIRSARRLNAARDADKPAAALPSRSKIWTGTLISQGVLLGLAWFTGSGFGLNIARPVLDGKDCLAALAALAAYFGLLLVSRIIRSADERRRMIVYQLMPQAPREWILWSATVVVASVAEEAAYRGVGPAILLYMFGNPWVAVLICSIAFALAHWTQGWKSAAVIFAMALVMHVLVWFTETLVLAMLVHAIYDFIAGYRISRTARGFEQEDR